MAKKETVVIGGREISLAYLENKWAGLPAYDDVKALVEALQGEEQKPEARQPGVWYSDEGAVYILEETGTTRRGVPELQNRFYFSIQTCHRDDMPAANKLADKLAGLLNAMGITGDE